MDRVIYNCLVCENRKHPSECEHCENFDNYKHNKEFESWLKEHDANVIEQYKKTINEC